MVVGVRVVAAMLCRPKSTVTEQIYELRHSNRDSSQYICDMQVNLSGFMIKGYALKNYLFFY